MMQSNLFITTVHRESGIPIVLKMVKLTIDLMARGTSVYTKKKKDEAMHHFLRRLTHLYLESKGINEVGDDISMCRNLTVLYLYDNQLPSIPNLNQNQCLTMLYLQNNHIDKIDGLALLTRLTKLYLGGNCITVIEGLDKLEKLQELHLENQTLPAGEKLLFEPRTIKAISVSLKVLNISGNNMDSIRDLECLTQMSHFIAIDNNLNDMKELAHVLEQWFFLNRLDLMGNPLCHKAKYRDRIIVMAKQLEILDGKEISETSKQFLQNWHANKVTQKQRKADMLLHRGVSYIADYPVGESRDLPPVREPVRMATIPGYMMPDLLISGATLLLHPTPNKRSSSAPVHRKVFQENSLMSYWPERPSLQMRVFSALPPH